MLRENMMPSAGALLCRETVIIRTSQRSWTVADK